MHRLIEFYQRYLSPLLPPRCRFLPTCSEYAREAMIRFGPIRGSWLALLRISRCHPFGSCGMDPVPDKFSWWPYGRDTGTVVED